MPGSITISITLALPVAGESTLLSVVTVSLVKVIEAAAAVALFERKMPRSARGGVDALNGLPDPPTPVAVDTKMVAGSLGCTSILLIDRPLKALKVTAPPPLPETTKGLIGPTKLGEVFALSIR